MSKVSEELSEYTGRYEIFIPSRERTDLMRDRRGAWKLFNPTSCNYPVKVVVRDIEEADYLQASGLSEFSPDQLGLGVTTTPSVNMDIAKTRQLIVEEAHERGLEYLFMLDDDVVLSYRDESLSSKYGSRVEELFARDGLNQCLLECLKMCGPEYPMVGLPLRFGSVSRKYMFEKNSTIIRFVCLHVPTLMKEGVSYTGLGGGVMEDYYVQLSLLSKGYRTMTNCRFAIDDYGTGKPGGCSTTRSVEVHNESAELLAQKFECVDLKWKKTSFWPEERLDCGFKPKSFLPAGELPYIPFQEAVDKFGLDHLRRGDEAQ